MRKLFLLLSLSAIGLLAVVGQALLAQDELAAVLEVKAPGVEVKRVNTSNWIEVKVEAIVGVGDVIRTDSSGRATIIFFADGTETELLSNTEYRIEKFEGNEDNFQISVSVLAGQTLQRVNRILDANSNYKVNTPGMDLVARGTVFRIRVEDSGRSGMLVDQGGVNASAGARTADVPPGYGVRSGVNENLSDVVAATTFEELDAALDGCAANIPLIDDMRLNVRLGPGLEFPRVGTLAPEEIRAFVGVIQSGKWYRVEFRGGYGWVLSSAATVSDDCAGLRIFPDDHGPEDPSLYSSLGEVIELELPTPEPTATPSD